MFRVNLAGARQGDYVRAGLTAYLVAFVADKDQAMPAEIVALAARKGFAIAADRGRTALVQEVSIVEYALHRFGGQEDLIADIRKDLGTDKAMAQVPQQQEKESTTPSPAEAGHAQVGDQGSKRKERKQASVPAASRRPEIQEEPQLHNPSQLRADASAVPEVIAYDEGIDREPVWEQMPDLYD